MKTKTIPSMRADAELEKLGNDIAIARKRRRFTQQRLADGAGVNVATIRRLENGDPGVSLGVLAMVLMTLGESGRIANLLDIGKDDIGLVLSVNDLPQRVRPKRQNKAVTGSESKSEWKSGNSEPEAF